MGDSEVSTGPKDWQKLYGQFGRLKMEINCVKTHQGRLRSSRLWIEPSHKHLSVAISMDGRGRALNNVFVERL